MSISTKPNDKEPAILMVIVMRIVIKKVIKMKIVNLEKNRIQILMRLCSKQLKKSRHRKSKKKKSKNPTMINYLMLIRSNKKREKMITRVTRNQMHSSMSSLLQK
jgi:hypothetical protein